VGRPPDSDSVVATTQYTQARWNATLVTPQWITQQVTIASANLVTQSWINQQISNYLSQSAVTTALTGYVPTSELGAASGVAQLNSNLLVPSGQLPTLVTNSLAVNYDAAISGVIILPSGQTATAQTDVIGAVPLAKVTIADPGYPWVPLPFAVVQGNAGGAGSGTRLAGNNNFGFLTVTPFGATSPIYAAGICTDDSVPNYYLCLPYGGGVGSVMTPLTQPPIIGSLTLLLSGCSWSGGVGGYVFSGTGMVFYVLVVPAVGV
jgi:hypothetical protein